MITLKQWMEAVKYRIIEGCAFGWNCFGDNAYCLDAWNGDHDGWSCSVTFDTITQQVYCVEAHDYKNNRAYRLVNPDYVEHLCNFGPKDVIDVAWDGVNYIDLEVDDDWLEKAAAIVEGKEYDTRVMISLELDDGEVVSLTKLADERGLTIDELVEQILREQIDKQLSSPPQRDSNGTD
jgi:hypothetical protein